MIYPYQLLLCLAFALTMTACIDNNESDNSGDQSDPTTESGSAAAQPQMSYRLSFVLNRNSRYPEAMDQAADVLRSMGASVTGKGTATLSARVSEEIFSKYFTAPGEQDTAGQSNASDDPNYSISVPDSLKSYIDLISVEPEHEHF